MKSPSNLQDQRPSSILAGALAHLAQHMESGCSRSAHLAVLLLEQIVNAPETDSHLREHAQQLVDILEREPRYFLNGGMHPPCADRQSTTLKCE